ncbi:MAG: ATP synthase F1 subunit delta [Roseburia sp.]|nr:ATP synthase F1 subunit delta [Roseburia sp.]
MAKLISKTYGEALFELAMEREPQEFLAQVTKLWEILEQNPDLDKLMRHPGISKQEKNEVLEEVFGGRIRQELLGFLKAVVSKERYKNLPDILQYFIARMKEYQRIGIAYVTTAVPLNASQQAQVEARLLQTTGYETMEMNYQEDPGLIGGMVIRIGDRVVDSSIRTRLNDLTRQLLQIQLG